MLLSRQAFRITASTGRVVRYVRAELSATVRAVHGPSCPRAELSGYRPISVAFYDVCGDMENLFSPYIPEFPRGQT